MSTRFGTISNTILYTYIIQVVFFLIIIHEISYHVIVVPCQVSKHNTVQQETDFLAQSSDMRRLIALDEPQLPLEVLDNSVYRLTKSFRSWNISIHTLGQEIFLFFLLHCVIYIKTGTPYNGKKRTPSHNFHGFTFMTA